MSSVFQFEIEVRIRNKKTQQERVAVYLEYAYAVTDVAYQTAVNHQHDLSPDEEFAGFNRIGPPTSVIEATQLELRRVIEQAVQRISKR